MKNLLLMRHGEAPYKNEHNAKQLDKDRMLNAVGKQQCLTIAAEFTDLDISHILSSDYQRAIDSAELFMKGLVTKGIVTKGIVTEGKVAEGLSEEFSDFINSQSQTLRPESDCKLAFQTINTEFDKLPEGKTLLVVCHMPIISKLAGLALEGSFNSHLGFPCASVMHLQADVSGLACYSLVAQHYAKNT